MKQTMKMMALTLTAVLMLSACGEETKPTAEETASTTVAVNAEEKTGTTEKIDYGDGTYEIYTYGDDGEVIKTVLYDENDGVIETVTYEYEKDAEGNLLKETMFSNGEKRSETIYTPGEDGEMYIAQGIEHLPDGTKEVYTYSMDGMSTTTENFDANGALTAKNVMTSDAVGNSTTVYYDGDGNVLKTELWEVKESWYVFTELDADGNIVTTEEIPFEGGFDGDEMMW